MDRYAYRRRGETPVRDNFDWYGENFITGMPHGGRCGYYPSISYGTYYRYSQHPETLYPYDTFSKKLQYGYLKRRNDIILVDPHDNKRICVVANGELNVSDRALRRTVYQGYSYNGPTHPSLRCKTSSLTCRHIPVATITAPTSLVAPVKPTDIGGAIRDCNPYPILRGRNTSRANTTSAITPDNTHFRPSDWKRKNNIVIYLNNDQDIVDIHGWRYVDTLGEGSYGKVYFVRNEYTGEESAFKRMLLHRLGGITPAIMREIQSLSLLNHDNIIKLKRVYIGECRLYLSFPRITGGNLRQFLERYYPNGMPLPMVRDIARQLVSAVAHIHSKRIIHRDIKPENILVQTDQSKSELHGDPSPSLSVSTMCDSCSVNGNCHGGLLSSGAEHPSKPKIEQVIITDFGLSRTHKSVDLPLQPNDEMKRMNSPMSPEVVTLCYRPPELLLGDYYYSFPVDIWSLGCVLFEIITGRPLFEERTEFALLIAMFKRFGTPREEDWPTVDSLPFMNSVLPNINTRSSLSECEGFVDKGCMDLLERMLTLSPKKRISAHLALKHQWIMKC